jgi:hypothetical protein
MNNVTLNLVVLGSPELTDYPSAIVLAPKDSEWGRRAVVVDLDGHRVELIESKP